MPRDSSGNYTLPTPYNPVLTGTTITTAWANTTMNDIAAALTDSLSRSGKGGVTSPFLIPDGTLAAPGLAFAGEQSTGLFRNGASQPTFTVGGVTLWAGTASHQFIVTAPGGEIINAPTTAVGLTVNENSTTFAIQVVGATGSSGSIAIQDGQTGTRNWGIFSGFTAPGSFDIRDITTPGTRITIDQYGAVTANAPSSGAAFTALGCTNQYTVTITGNSSIANQNFGLNIKAGTAGGTADYPLTVQVSSGTTIWQGFGDGSWWLYPSTNNQDLSGNVQFRAGYLDAPVRTATTTGTLSLSDRGKTIVLTGGAGSTVTLPNTFVANGSMILIVNLSGGAWNLAAAGTLTWLPSASTTQPRNLANNSVTTCWQNGANWYVWGLGIS